MPTLPLLLAAYNRCWLPHFPDQAPLAVAELETLVRELQLDCEFSSVAVEHDEPIAVLLAAKRDGEALVYRLAVHPDHAGKKIARKLLTELSAKLAVAGPVRIRAEVPEELASACALFERCGFARDTLLTDYELDPTTHAPGASGAAPDDSFLVGVTLDDVLADPLLGGITAPAWERSAATVIARRDGIQGLALAALNSIAAILLYRKLGAERGTEIVVLRALDAEEGESAAGCLVDSVLRRTPKPLTFRSVHEQEVPGAWLQTWGFRPQRRILRYVSC